MAKNQKGKPTSAAGGRNPDRRNGKAWSRHSGKGGSHPGHRLTGRTKPSGKTVGGHALVTVGLERVETTVSGHSVDHVKASRNTRHRADLRRTRKTEAAARAKAKR